MAIGGILSSTGSELTVNLTWSNSRCVVVYYVEVTTNNINITNMTTSAQHIVLPLQIGVVYSFRVRGADSINRLGEWSDSFVYTPVASKWKNAFTIIIMHEWVIMCASDGMDNCRSAAVYRNSPTCVVVVMNKNKLKLLFYTLHTVATVNTNN